MNRQPISPGFAVGLQIWLLFLLSFYWLGYSTLFSIGLGAFGGLASGFIVDWWVSKEEQPDPAPQTEEVVTEVETKRRKRRRNSAFEQRRRRKQKAAPIEWEKFNPFKINGNGK